MTFGKESYFWHKLHSLSGIVPVGFYMVQHLTLNSFSIAGPERFNGVIGFFASIPSHILLTLEVVAIWIPLLFHAVYGCFIVSRGEGNYSQAAYRFRENRYYTLQRASGLAAFAFLIYHVITTTVNAKLNGHQVIEYAAWHDKLTGTGYFFLVLYMLGVAACTYHLSYGIWNFCIRWGITVSAKSQEAMGKFSAGCFVALTALGWFALIGFLPSPHGTADGGGTVNGELRGSIRSVADRAR